MLVVVDERKDILTVAAAAELAVVETAAVVVVEFEVGHSHRLVVDTKLSKQKKIFFSPMEMKE